MGKKLTIIAVVVVIGIAVLFLFKDAMIKVSIEKGIEAATGLRLEIGGFALSLGKGSVAIRDLKLYNPPAFTDPVMVTIPEIYIEIDVNALRRKELHLRDVRFNLSEFTVIKNADGALNLDALTVVNKNKGAGKTKTAPAREAALPPLRIDSLTLVIGKAVYKDYSAGTPPKITTFNVNLNERYTNITDPQALVSLIVLKAIGNTTIASLANFDTTALTGTAAQALASAQKVTTQATAVATETLKTTGATLTGAAGSLTQTSGALKTTTTQAQNVVAEAGTTVSKTTEQIGGFLKGFGGTENER